MISIVEKENRNDYIAVQYVIQDKWELHITRNPDVNDENVWMMQRKTPEGQLISLKGKRKIFDDSKSKCPKIY